MIGEVDSYDWGENIEGLDEDILIFLLNKNLYSRNIFVERTLYWRIYTYLKLVLNLSRKLYSKLWNNKYLIWEIFGKKYFLLT